MATCPVLVSDDELVRQATLAAQKGNVPEAAELLAEACRLNPSNTTAWLWRASIAQSTGETLGYLDAVLRVDPSNAAAKEWIARLATAPKPKPVPVVRDRPCPFCSHGTDTAADRCPSCRGVMRFDIDLIENNSLAHAAQLRFAIQHYQQFDPSDPEVPLRIALCHLNLFEWQPALEHLRLAVSLGADDSDVFDTLARLDELKLVVVAGSPGERRNEVVAAFHAGGYRALAVERLSELMAAIERELPSLVVIDLTTGLYSGFELCKEVRHHPKAGETPVMIATKGSVLDTMRGRHVGATLLVPGAPAAGALVEAASRKLTAVAE